jgi:hypothetical protein
MEAQYANMNRAAFNTRRTSSPIPRGAIKGDTPDRPGEPRVFCRWDTSGPAPLTLAEQIAKVRAKMAQTADDLRAKAAARREAMTAQDAKDMAKIASMGISRHAYVAKR